MRVSVLFGAIASIFLLNGCVGVSSVEPSRSSDCDCAQELDAYKKYQECINDYILRIQKCSYYYRSGEDIIRNTQVDKCVREMYPDGKESCNPYE
jgi:hypothetical protein